MSEVGSIPGQGTPAKFEITDLNCVSTPGKLTKGKALRKTGETVERRTSRLLEGYHLAENSTT